MPSIEAPPAQAPVPVSEFLSLDSLTQGEIANRIRGVTSGMCDIRSGQRAEEAKAEAAAGKEPREFAWSDNLHTDIEKARTR